MAFADIPLFGMLKTGMRWHEARQRVLAENVANAETPGFRARDIERPDFAHSLAAAATPAVTDPRHISTASAGGFSPTVADGHEITPRGNSVDAEEEMMRVGQNVQDYQLVAQLYSRSLGLLRTAAGRRG